MFFCNAHFLNVARHLRDVFLQTREAPQNRPKEHQTLGNKPGQDKFCIQISGGLVLPPSGDILPYAIAVQRHSYFGSGGWTAAHG